MTQPVAPVARPVRPAWTGWTLNRAMVLVAAICMVIAALVAGDVFTGQSWIAWVCGAVAAWFLSWVV